MGHHERLDGLGQGRHRIASRGEEAPRVGIDAPDVARPNERAEGLGVTCGARELHPGQPLAFDAVALHLGLVGQRRGRESGIRGQQQCSPGTSRHRQPRQCGGNVFSKYGSASMRAAHCAMGGGRMPASFDSGFLAAMRFT